MLRLIYVSKTYDWEEREKDLVSHISGSATPK